MGGYLNGTMLLLGPMEMTQLQGCLAVAELLRYLSDVGGEQLQDTDRDCLTHTAYTSAPFCLTEISLEQPTSALKTKKQPSLKMQYIVPHPHAVHAMFF